MYMTSFRLLPEQKPLLNQLVNVLPTVTVIELDIVIKEMRSVVDQVARALELVLGVILMAGGLVLISGVRSSLDGRLRESALLRAVGARRGLVLGALWIEFLVLGGLAGGLASVGAEVAAWGLQTQVFEMTWAPTPLMWWLGPLAGAVIVGPWASGPVAAWSVCPRSCCSERFSRLRRLPRRLPVAVCLIVVQGRYPSRWATASRSSASSCAVASILPRLNSAMSSPWTISHCPA